VHVDVVLETLKGKRNLCKSILQEIYLTGIHYTVRHNFSSFGTVLMFTTAHDEKKFEVALGFLNFWELRTKFMLMKLCFMCIGMFLSVRRLFHYEIGDAGQIILM